MSHSETRTRIDYPYGPTLLSVSVTEVTNCVIFLLTWLLLLMYLYTWHAISTMIMNFVWLWNNFSFNVYYYLQHGLQTPWSSCIFSHQWPVCLLQLQSSVCLRGFQLLSNVVFICVCFTVCVTLGPKTVISHGDKIAAAGGGVYFLRRGW